MMLHCPFFTQPESLFSKILPTLISVLVVVLIFIIGRYFDSKIRSKEIKRNWFLNIIVIPNIKTVDCFINEILNSTNKSYQTLVAAKNSNTFNDYISIKSKEFGTFQKIKRVFEFDFLSLVQSGSDGISILLSIKLNKLEDDIMNILDKENFEISDMTNIEKKIKSFKSEFYSILYNQIE